MTECSSLWLLLLLLQRDAILHLPEHATGVPSSVTVQRENESTFCLVPKEFSFVSCQAQGTDRRLSLRFFAFSLRVEPCVCVHPLVVVVYIQSSITHTTHPKGKLLKKTRTENRKKVNFSSISESLPVSRF